MPDERESICIHCGKRIVRSASVFFEDSERWYHPGNVSSDSGGRSCRDANRKILATSATPQPKDL